MHQQEKLARTPRRALTGMFSAVLDKVTGLLEGRFTTTYVYPTGAALAAAGLISWSANEARWPIWANGGQTAA